MAELQEQFNALQEKYNGLEQTHTALGERCNGLEQTNAALQEKYNGLEQTHGALQEKYNGLEQNHAALGEKCNGLEQTLGALQEKCNGLEQSNAALEEKYKALEIQLNNSQTDLTTYKNELDAMTEKYNQLANVSGIDNLRDLFKKLTDPQKKALHDNTNFRVDTFEMQHGKQQIQCSTQFVEWILTQLKSSVDKVVQLEQNTLTQRNHASVSAFEAYTIGNVPQNIKDACIKPLEAEIEEIQVKIGEWKTFTADLNGVLNRNQSISISVVSDKLEEDNESV